MALVIKQTVADLSSAVGTTVSVAAATISVSADILNDVSKAALSIVKSMPTFIKELYEFIATLTVESIKAITDIDLRSTALNGREIAKSIIDWFNENDIDTKSQKGGYMGLK